MNNTATHTVYRVYTNHDWTAWRDFDDKAKATEFASREGVGIEEIERD